MGREPEDQEALDLAADWADISQGLRKDLGASIHAPLWLNVFGLLFAIAAVFADYLHLSTGVMAIAALGAVLCFGLSGTKVIHALRKRK